MHARQIFTNLFERIFSQQFLIFSKHSDQFSDCRDFAKCLNMLQTWQDRKTSREKFWSQISHDVLLLERGYLIKKLIMLIPGKICYRLVLQHARNYEKKVKAPFVHYC